MTLAHPRSSQYRFRLALGMASLLLVALFAVASPALGQAAGEYGGGAGVSATTTSSVSRLGGAINGAMNGASRSISLANPSGLASAPVTEKANREWFAKQAGKTGAQLTVDASPAKSEVWIDGKYVGAAPLTLTLPAGKHDLSLLGPHEQHAERKVEISSGKNQRLAIPLVPVYPAAVTIPFGKPAPQH